MSKISISMMRIPAGEFMMGSPENCLDAYNDETPQHLVKVPEFWMSKYPVTQAQWRTVAKWEPVDINLNPDPSQFKGDSLPVERVNWYEAVEFCNRLSRFHQSRIYHLPTEAQWEYACRAGTTTPYSFGTSINTNLVNYDGIYDGGFSRNTTTPVGSFPANPWGLHDMHGNVYEWCADDWHINYNAKPKPLIENGSIPWIDQDIPDLPEEDAPDITFDNTLTLGYNCEPDDTTDAKVVRGGSWYNHPTYCRSAYRRNNHPDKHYGRGFRVAAEPKTLRGGSWNTLRRGCRSACRYGFHPDDRSGVIDFRVAAEPKVLCGSSWDYRPWYCCSAFRYQSL